MTKTQSTFSVVAVTLLLLAMFPMFNQPTAAQSEAGAVGACIDFDACFVVTVRECFYNFGGVWIGEGSSCASDPIVLFSSPSEACCLPGGNCVELTPALCAEAGGSPSIHGTDCFLAACPQSCYADVDSDGTVGILDFLDLLAAWGDCS